MLTSLARDVVVVAAGTAIRTLIVILLLARWIADGTLFPLTHEITAA